MPLDPSDSRLSRASSRTSSGRTAGPAEKLKMRWVVMTGQGTPIRSFSPSKPIADVASPGRPALPGPRKVVWFGSSQGAIDPSSRLGGVRTKAPKHDLSIDPGPDPKLATHRIVCLGSLPKTSNSSSRLPWVFTQNRRLIESFWWGPDPTRFTRWVDGHDYKPKPAPTVPQYAYRGVDGSWRKPPLSSTFVRRLQGGEHLEPST